MTVYIIQSNNYIDRIINDAEYENRDSMNKFGNVSSIRAIYTKDGYEINKCLALIDRNALMLLRALKLAVITLKNLFYNKKICLKQIIKKIPYISQFQKKLRSLLGKIIII